MLLSSCEMLCLYKPHGSVLKPVKISFLGAVRVKQVKLVGSLSEYGTSLAAPQLS